MTIDLYVNDNLINLEHQPKGLEEFKVSLKRDTIYSGIDTNLDIEIQFFCTSGKTEIDAEYLANGLDANAYIVVTDECGSETATYKFKLDFKNFNTTDDFCTCSLIQLDDLAGGALNWKDELKRNVNLTLEGIEDDLYVRNLPLVYDYESENVYGSISQDSLNTQHNSPTPNPALGPPWLFNTTPPTVPPATAPPPPDNFYILYSHHIIPKVDQIVNELEESDGLLADFIRISLPYSLFLSPNPVNYYYMEVVDLSNVSTFSGQVYSEFEPHALFSNRLDSGDFFLETNNTQIELNFNNVATINTELIEVSEIISVGRKFESPRFVIKNQLKVTPATITSAGIQTYTLSKTFSRTFEVYELENVWIYYDITFKSTQIANPTWNAGLAKWDYGASLANVITFNDIKYKITNTIECEFMLTKNVTSTLAGSTLSDIEPYHTLVKAYRGDFALNRIFKSDNNLAETPCFEDIWFTDGQRMRNKVNMSDFIVKPQDIFTELEKITCCGLGVFYDNSGNATLQLQDVYTFYSDSLVHSFAESDIANFKISNISSNYYNEIKIGYSNFKDTEKDYCKTNEYTIDNKGESIYNKVCEWIASKYIVTRALKMSTDDKEMEFDKNIFLLSSKILSSSPEINITLAESLGVVNDDMFLNPNSLGLNRRYASVMNLFRHLYKWGFSLFANKDTLNVNKYEGSTIYNEEIRHTLGTPPDPYYQGLSSCKLPLDFVKVDRVVDGLYTSSSSTYDGKINVGLHVPMDIEFEVYNMTSIDLIRMRPKQYGLFKVTNNGVDYYGNLMSAVHDNGVTKFNLLRRFNNGL